MAERINHTSFIRTVDNLLKRDPVITIGLFTALGVAGIGAISAYISLERQAASPSGNNPVPAEKTPFLIPSETPFLPSTVEPTVVATEIPTETASATAPATAPATATEASAAIPGTEIVSHYTETINASDTKYNIPVTIITDEKIVNANWSMTIDKIYANDNPDFRTRYGETSKEAIAHAVAYAEYQCWQKNDSTQVSQRAGVSFDAYWQMVKDAQNGQRPWSDVEFQTWANDLTTPEYDALTHTFRPGNPVTVANVDSYQNTMVNYYRGAIYLGTEVDNNGNLCIYIGGYPLVGSIQGTVVDSTVAVNFAMALDRLSWTTQGNLLPQNEFYEHVAPVGRYNSAIFNILSTPSTPPEDWAQRFTGWPWVPGYYDTALAISPNDEVSKP